jgi:hypothetical protein
MPPPTKPLAPRVLQTRIEKPGFSLSGDWIATLIRPSEAKVWRSDIEENFGCDDRTGEICAEEGGGVATIRLGEPSDI